MATFTQLLGLQSGIPNATTSGDTINFASYTVTGVTATGIDDGTGDLTFDGSGNLSSTGIVAMELDAADTTSLSMTANNAAAKTLTIASTNAGAGVANLDVNVDDAITVDSTNAGISLDGAAASNFTVTGGNLTLSTATSGDLILSSAGDASLTVVTNSATAFVLNDTAGTPVDFLAVDTTTATPKITVGSTLSSFRLDASKGAGSELVVKANVAAGTSAFTIEDDAGTPKSYLKVQTTTGSETVQFEVAATLNQQDGTTPLAQKITAGGTFSAGDVLAVNGTSGQYSQADANGTGTLSTVTGVAVGAGSAGNPSAMAVHGVANVTFTATVATSAIGSFAYLSGTAGQASTTAPSASGDRVYKVGVIVNADGTTTAQVLIQPQFLYDIP